MKIVVDANVVVSGLIWNGVPGVIIDRVVDGLDVLFMSASIIDEICEVFRKPKFRKHEKRAVSFIAQVRMTGRLATVSVSNKYRITGVCRDPDDDKYLECALAAGADYIISGDRDLLDLKEYGGVKIVSARDYLDVVGG